jgi:hypothetical protein
MNERELINSILSELIDDLCHLISIKIQNRYIIYGTQESYLTPDDLLDNLDSTLLFFYSERFPERIKSLDAVFCSHD